MLTGLVFSGGASPARAAAARAARRWLFSIASSPSDTLYWRKRCQRPCVNCFFKVGRNPQPFSFEFLEFVGLFRHENLSFRKNRARGEAHGG